MSHAEWEELAAGYALNALEPQDEQAFGEHLAGCARCTRDLAALHEVTGELAYAAEPAEPPDALRERIMAAAAAERPPAERPVTPVAPRRTSWRPAFRAPTLAAAAAVVLVAGLAAWNVVLRADGQVRRAALERRERALGCLAAPDTAKFRLSSDGPARAATCVAGDRAYVVTDRLDRNGPRSVYVLWWQDAARAMHAVERFDVTDARTAVYELPIAAPPADIRAMAISLEPGRALPSRPTRAVVSGPRAT